MGKEQRTQSVMAFAARERKHSKREAYRCHCGKYGHAEAGCHKIIGYLAGWGTQGWGRGQRGGRGIGGRITRGAGHESLNSAGSQTEQVMIAAYAGPKTEASMSIPGLTAEQIHKLLTLIDTPKGGYEKLPGITPWLIDSRSLCHMTGDLKTITKS